MAIGVIGLTSRGRYLCAIVFLTLITIQCLLGLIIIIWAIYICRVISPNLYSEQVEVSFLFTVIGIFGSHVLFHGIAGFKICHKCYKRSQKKNTRYAVFIWTLVGYNILMDIYLLATRINAITKHIENALERSFETGMQYYLKDPYWKRTIDYIQSDFYCCGLTDYKTWYKIIWLDENQLKMDNPLVQELRLSETKPLFPVTPWSCCNIEYPLQCLHDPFQQPESAYLWKEEPLLIEQSIYNTGCLSILTRPVVKASKAFIITTCCIFLFMVCSICVVRILFTSCRNNIILQHDSGISPGWIFGRGDCGWSHGPTLDQIMTVILSKKNSSSKDDTPKASKSVKTRDHRKRSKMITKKRKSLVFKEQPENYKSAEEPVSSGDEKALMLQ